ncbi:MAG: CRISPR-associated protein Csx3 [Candidatus Hydrothermarchaeota archaeon]|nr:MAG: CRISPR-associated protein Csx3 [Candidatus Hydrothermarchaeota archaeon]
MIEFKVVEKEEFTFVHFELKENLTPDILQKFKPPEVNSMKGIILSGRGPIWLYCYLVHHYHPTKFIATFDPRVGGAIVVESHNQIYRPGDVIDVDVSYK